jgi:hypothetical protein
MEKIILIGIAVWISFVLSDGFPPQKPVKKPDKQKTEISKQQTSKPEGVKYRWIKTHYD